MRVHVGFSFTWKSIRKWIILILFGLLSFFGISYFTMIDVHAEAVNQPWAVYQVCGHQGTCTGYQGATPPYQAKMPSYINDMVYLDNLTWYGHFAFDPSYEYTITFSITGSKFSSMTTDYIWNSPYTFYLDNNGTRINYNYFKWEVYNPSSGTYQFELKFNPSSTADNFGFSLSFQADQLNINNPISTNTNLFYFSSMQLTKVNVSETDIKLEEIKDQIGSITGSIGATNDKLNQVNDNLNDVNQSINDVNQGLDNVNNSLTNPDVDSNTGNNFFNNFTSSDNGGISSIVTAPLTLINSLLDNSSSCQPLTLPILGKDVDIPSGCILWNEVPSNVEVVIQTLVCGVGAYFLGKKLFKDIDKLKNPNNSEVSTLDL